MIPLSPLTIRTSSTEIKVHISLGNKTYKLNLLFLSCNIIKNWDIFQQINDTWYELTIMHSVMPGLPYYCNVLIPILISTATVLVWTHRQSGCITDSCRRVPRTLSVKQSTPCMHLMLSNEAWKDRYLSNMCACMCNETAVKILQQ